MKKIVGLLVACFFIHAQPAYAYYTNMPASVVVGQENFTLGAANQGGSTSATSLSGPRGVFIDPHGRLIVSDAGNRRVLIWNQVPTQNNVPADLVLGQADFTGNLANRGGSAGADTLNGPTGIFSDGTRLVVVDRVNHRVLIWNTFPTQNGQPADVVAGKSTMTDSALYGCLQSSLDNPDSVYIYNNKMIVSSKVDRRVYVWNSVPTSNGTLPDVVVGHLNFTSCGVNATDNMRVYEPRGVTVDKHGRLYVVSDVNDRVMVWNSIPTQNGQPADLVIGQDDFASVTGGTSASRFLLDQSDIATDNDLLFLPDRLNHRVVIFNGLPFQNGASASIVLGQNSFSANAQNGGGTISASSFSFPDRVFARNNKLVVADAGQNRVLIFYNDVYLPTITLDNNPVSRQDGVLRMSGLATITAPGLLRSVEYSVNGGGWSGATAADGGFDETSEAYYFEFDPKSNNNSKEGYVVQTKAKNTNLDEVGTATYFEPFRSNAPENNARIDNKLPAFSFTVNSQRQLLYEGLQKYMVMVKKGREDWRVYADEIPVNYDYAKDKAENTAEKKSDTNGNGVYEDSKIKVTYSDDGSRLEVYSKEESKKLVGGSYQWKVVAVDKAGHTQETGSRYLRMSAGDSESWFPLTIEFITGVGKTSISTLHPSQVKSAYTTTVSNPTFSGTAVSGSIVNITLTEQKCISDICSTTFEVVTDISSKYSIKLPLNTVKLGKKYDLLATVYSDDEYNELPIITLSRKSKQ